MHQFFENIVMGLLSVITVFGVIAVIILVKALIKTIKEM